jgi:beta-galactosidase beta subunit
MLFPHEAHAPQVSIDEKLENVLKVVVKIKI